MRKPLVTSDISGMCGCGSSTTWSDWDGIDYRHVRLFGAAGGLGRDRPALDGAARRRGVEGSLTAIAGFPCVGRRRLAPPDSPLALRDPWLAGSARILTYGSGDWAAGYT